MRLRRAALVAALLGVSIAMAIVGLCTRLRAEFAGLAHCSDIVVGSALLALAIGVRAPRRLAVWACASAWRRFVKRGQPSALSDTLLRPGSSDRSLYWLALSIIALVSGVITALWPINAKFAMATYVWMNAHFIWSPIPLLVLQTATIVLAGFVPLAAMGLSVSCVHHVACRFGQWDSRALPWLLVGSAGGVLIAAQIVRLTSQVNLVLVAAALPVLLVSLVCAVSGPVRRADSSDGPGARSMSLPTWRDRWPTLLRLSIVVVGCSGVFALALLVRYAGRSTALDGYPVVLATLLGAMGVGGLLGSRLRHSGLRSIGGFGVACAVAGAVTLLSAFAHSRMDAPPPLFGLLAGCVTVGTLMMASAYGHQVLLHRVANRSSAGATILGRLFLGSLLTICLVVPVLTRLTTMSRLLAALSIVLLTLSAAMIAHEPAYSARSRNVRFFAVITVVVAVAAFAVLSADPGQIGSPAAVGPSDGFPTL
ncbi:MAG: hypothetical protein JSU63_11225 [Phycisphaerales bacterium]|nr:MAG: hypothetical protein JSU63_11225 [Phycisphaerales bacterium]